MARIEIGVLVIEDYPFVRVELLRLMSKDVGGGHDKCSMSPVIAWPSTSPGSIDELRSVWLPTGAPD